MPRAAALFARQLLAAAERDSRSPREAAGTAARAPRAELPQSGRRWAVLAAVSAAQFLIILDLWVVNITRNLLRMIQDAHSLLRGNANDSSKD